MQIIVIIFFVIILFIILLLSLSNGEDQKRIAGKEGELQAKKILNHYLNENDLLLNNVNISIHGRNTELDYVVINNNGIFIFEVKNFSGKLVGNEDDQYWNKYKISRGNKEYIKEIRNPIKQLKREIYLLKEYLKYYGVDLWIEGYVLFVNMNSPVESEYTINDQSEIDDILHLRRNQALTKNQIEKIISILK
ncbi:MULTISPECIES: nuclease-related domain-containing protein [unclassified Faecalibacillus]|uniref:nuclease-related domain-containing protein n=1 Tax=unclassified Faecalibacillus TaxID=2678890 RepID=UPI001D0B387B|nr:MULTISPECIES: nuclease-related domain-containing protein [unclassified Faecalibacillus]MCB8541415.1 NERD domain-containing protein [Faecalibacillus sp. TM498]MCB8559086.1 NERD domain-containing protein [Faecalibacillus sp. TM111]